MKNLKSPKKYEPLIKFQARINDQKDEGIHDTGHFYLIKIDF